MKKGYFVVSLSSKTRRDKLISLVKLLLKDKFKVDFLDEQKSVITMSDDLDFAIIHSSFKAMKEDIDDGIKILIIPTLKKEFYDLVDLLNPGDISTLYELCNEKHELYDDLGNILDDFDVEVLNTVTCYIEENKSPLLSSLRLYCHRNTVSYRVKTFEKKTKISLHSFFNYLFIYSLIKHRLAKEVT